MIRIAFASTDDIHVNTHFGAAERFVVYDVSPGQAELVGVGEFKAAIMKGENKDRALPAGTRITPGEEMRPTPAELEKPPEDKVLAKLAFIQGCAAVYAASIGNSSIKRLMSIDVQPVIVGHNQPIMDLLNEVSLALASGGLSWVSRAQAKAKAANRFEQMEADGWQPGAPAQAAAATPPAVQHTLITSIEDEASPLSQA